jgi:hypothetical protein
LPGPAAGCFFADEYRAFVPVGSGAFLRFDEAITQNKRDSGCAFGRQLGILGKNSDGDVAIRATSIANRVA